TRNHAVYGIAQAGEVSSRIILSLEKNTADKYNISLPEQCSFYDLETILEEIAAKNGADIFKDMIPILSKDPLAPIYMAGYYIDLNLGTENYMPSGKPYQLVYNSIYFKKDANGNWLAVNPAKEETIISLMKQIKKYVDKGWYTADNRIISATTEHLFEISSYYNYLMFDNKITDSETNESSVEIIDILTGTIDYLPYCSLDNYITGIASCSEYKDEAFKFLSLINTEEKLSNLLLFGVEGTDWEYKNGELFDLTTGNRIITSGRNFALFSNISLIPSTYLDPEDKVTAIKELSAKHEASPLITHNIDVSAYTEKLKTINAIYCAYMGRLLVGEYEDIDGVMAQMNSMLEEAGINEIIDDINKQMQQ
ncbi:MAG: DUF3502 domain-containing protein, partial [Lachnospiraceae bacterium]|nr:DUF3502 domain-containing protein [Lachnospiraceae bacterium]